MASKTDQGYLLLADITGYTSYVAQTELEHSQEVLAELMELIVDQVTPIMTLSKLEGDAVFAYVSGKQVLRGETLLELMEATYYIFRTRIESIKLRTTCECEACRAIPSLDLKFLLHYGEYILQSISGINELVGSDVNLVHRLAKNSVKDDTGWDAYVLCTHPTVQAIGVEMPGIHTKTEAYEHLGEIETYVYDLHARYDEMTAERHNFISKAEAFKSGSFEFDLPAPVVWDWMTDPQKRNLYQPGNTWSAAVRPGGRTGAGAQNHCAHGKDELSVEQVLDWRPFEYYTVHSKFKPHEESPIFDTLQTFHLIPGEDGQHTTLEINVKSFASGFIQTQLSKLWNLAGFSFFFKKQFALMEEMAKEELSSQQLSPNFKLLMELTNQPHQEN